MVVAVMVMAMIVVMGVLVMLMARAAAADCRKARPFTHNSRRPISMISA